MITFHNDHLVSPEFCKLIYATVPEEYHIPVILVPHTKEFRFRGACSYNSIELNLQAIFYHGYPGEFKLWKNLLSVTYHEFGHKANEHLTNHISIEEYWGYENGYHLTEQLAIDWANKKLLELAEIDTRLCQPKQLGPYFDGRIIKRKNETRTHGELILWVIEEYRKFACGGQLSATEVAKMFGAYKYPKYKGFSFEDRSNFEGKFEGRYEAPDTRLVRKLAKDLAYIYTDHFNRKHMYFAWGDCEEIGRRVAGYKAMHGPGPSEIEYIEECKREQSEWKQDSALSSDQDLLDF